MDSHPTLELATVTGAPGAARGTSDVSVVSDAFVHELGWWHVHHLTT